MKNCEPLVSFPRFAIDNRNSLSWFRMKFSSEHPQQLFIKQLLYIWQKNYKLVSQPLNSAYYETVTQCSKFILNHSDRKLILLSTQQKQASVS